MVGIPTGQYALFEFFGFLTLFFVKNDELLKKNIEKASTNAFIVSLICFSITMISVAIFETMDIAMIGFALTFVLQMLTYSFSIGFYERR